MTAPLRSLVDWDWGAHGIWLVLSPEELNAPAPKDGRRVPFQEQVNPPLRPWSDRLSNELLDALQEWNDDCGDRARRGPRYRTDEDESLDQRQRMLAEQVQGELDAEWEVLYFARGAHHWVRQPHNWA